MASFDGFLAGLFGGSDQSETYYDVPPTALELTSEQIKNMPNAILKVLIDMLVNGINKADESVKHIRKKAMLETGLLEYDTDKGTYVLLSDTSKYGLDGNEGAEITDIQSFTDYADSTEGKGLQ
jgi:hypothetical protein